MVYQDRLSELRARLGEPVALEEETANDHVDETSEDDPEVALRKFREDIDFLTEKMNEFESVTAQIEELTASRVNEGLAELLKQSGGSAMAIRAKLKSLKSENEEMRQDEEKRDTSICVLRTNTTSRISKRFCDLIKRNHEAQEEYKKSYMDRVTRQAKIAHPDITENELNDIIETGDIDTLFQEQLLEQTKHAQASAALIFIQQQHNDLLELQKSLVELHQMFIDMATIVEAQGELYNRIEDHIQQTAIYTGKALKELEKAEKAAVASRKRCCALCCCAGTAAAGGGAAAASGACGGLAPLAALAACSIM